LQGYKRIIFLFSIKNISLFCLYFKNTKTRFKALFAMMMRQTLFILSILFSGVLFGQSRQVIVDWGERQANTKQAQAFSRVSANKSKAPIKGTARFSTATNNYTEVWTDNGFANA